ncbi:hypothetical protein [uncultured Sphingomonas sp.]|uniref:hypothetical protein n=1 Tax=uncultured Sphingomonas sp. TaxID=158754 RepID=UPI002639FECD|nr:hypothetical protein [uncultured Sphingomonas sp.]
MGANDQRGNRTAIAAETMNDEQRAELAASRPTAAEIAADRWADEPEIAPEKSRRAKLRLPFRT